MVAVTIRGLEKSYGSNTILPGVDLTIANGEFVTLLGPSGCGKTTTLRCVAGLERPTGGEIRLGEHIVSDRNTFVPPNKRNLGMVFQSYALWPHMSVFQNVVYPLRTARVPRSQRADLVTEALRRVGLDHLATRGVGTLSGGQQQRVALARAIVGNPQLILFDEPLSNLDAKLRATMRTELRMLHDRLGSTSIFVTHDQTEALTLSDRVIVMNHGEIQQMGTPEELYALPVNPFVADFVGFENIVPSVIVSSSDSTAAVRLSDGTTVHGRVERRLEAGRSALCAFRANAIELAADPTSPSLVESVTFLGEQREFLVKVGTDRIRVRADVHSLAGSQLRVGDRVDLNARQSGVLVFPQPDDGVPAVVDEDAAAHEIPAIHV